MTRWYFFRARKRTHRCALRNPWFLRTGLGYWICPVCNETWVLKRSPKWGDYWENNETKERR